MQVAPFLRVRMCRMPTPLEPLTRRTERLGAPRLYIKRSATGVLVFTYAVYAAEMQSQ